MDLRWARSQPELTLKSERFRAAILDIATPLHGKAKDDIDAADLRAHRRSRRLAFGGVAVLSCLTAGPRRDRLFRGRATKSGGVSCRHRVGRAPRGAGGRIAGQGAEPRRAQHAARDRGDAAKAEPRSCDGPARRHESPADPGRARASLPRTERGVVERRRRLAGGRGRGRASPASRSVVLVIDTTSGAELLRAADRGGDHSPGVQRHRQEARDPSPRGTTRESGSRRAAGHRDLGSRQEAARAAPAGGRAGHRRGVESRRPIPRDRRRARPRCRLGGRQRTGSRLHPPPVACPSGGVLVRCRASRLGRTRWNAARLECGDRSRRHPCRPGRLASIGLR